MFPYDLYLRLIIVSYFRDAREFFLLLLSFFIGEIIVTRLFLPRINPRMDDGRTFTSSVFHFYYDSLALNCALPIGEPEPSRH